MTSRPQPDFDALIALARAGDMFALDELLAEFRHYLQLLARHQLRNRLPGKIDDSDLVQETLLDAHRGFAAFRGQRSCEFTAWLREILAHNLAQQFERYYGAQRRDPRLEQRLVADLNQSSQAFETAFVSKQASPSEIADRQDQAHKLANLLGRLPPSYREVIVLRHIDELSFRQVAERMKRSEDSVKHLWTRAIIAMRRHLAEAP
jgi:RNA polymerase sigma-70 factor (ECF subfamily)